MDQKRSRPAMTMATSPRVANLLFLYDLLSVDEQKIFRDIVELAWRRRLTERLAAGSVPFKIPTGTLLCG